MHFRHIFDFHSLVWPHMSHRATRNRMEQQLRETFCSSHGGCVIVLIKHKDIKLTAQSIKRLSRNIFWEIWLCLLKRRMRHTFTRTFVYESELDWSSKISASSVRFLDLACVKGLFFEGDLQITTLASKYLIRDDGSTQKGLFEETCLILTRFLKESWTITSRSVIDF